MATYYVDPSTGNDTTGDGSSGTPWKTIQHALDNGTWSSAAPNTLKVANTAADVLTAALSCAGMSTVPGVETPLTIEGWDNGGSLTATGPKGTTISPVGEIDGNDAVASILSLQSYVSFKNMKMHSTTGTIFRLGSCSMVNCEIYNGGSTSVVRAVPFVYNTYVHQDVAGSTICLYQCSDIINCETNGGLEGIEPAAPGVIMGNIVRGFTSEGIDIDEDGQVFNNTIDGTGANSDAEGITCTAADERANVFNNLVTNMSGATAKGIYLPAGSAPSLIGNNAFYNNTTDLDAPTPSVSLSDVTETSDPFTDRANADYSLVAGANSNGAALLTNADPDNPDNIGAAQDYASGGGGGGETTSVFMA